MNVACMPITDPLHVHGDVGDAQVVGGNAAVSQCECTCIWADVPRAPPRNYKMGQSGTVPSGRRAIDIASMNPGLEE